MSAGQLIKKARPWIDPKLTPVQRRAHQVELVARNLESQRRADAMIDAALDGLVKSGRGRPPRLPVKGFRLLVRYQAHLERGTDPQVALELAAVSPDIYGAVLRMTGEKSAASAALEGWIGRYKKKRDEGRKPGTAAVAAWQSWTTLRLSDLEKSEHAAHVSVGTVKLALARWRKPYNHFAINTYERMKKTLAVKDAFLATCRECGFGSGRAVGDRWVGFSELKRVLREAGHSEVAGLRLSSPRARRKAAS